MGQGLTVGQSWILLLGCITIFVSIGVTAFSLLDHLVRLVQSEWRWRRMVSREVRIKYEG